jgi:hypothetical protein
MATSKVCDGQYKLWDRKAFHRYNEGCPWVFVDGHEAGILMENAISEQKGNGEADPKSSITAPRLPLEEGWHEERLLDDDGKEIFINYKGEPSRARYEFIRDYLDLKLKRMKGKTEKNEN